MIDNQTKGIIIGILLTLAGYFFMNAFTKMNLSPMVDLLSGLIILCLILLLVRKVKTKRKPRHKRSK